jgi:hypothetical protein
LDPEIAAALQQAEMLRTIVAPMEEEIADLKKQLKAARSAAQSAPPTPAAGTPSSRISSTGDLIDLAPDLDGVLTATTTTDGTTADARAVELERRLAEVTRDSEAKLQAASDTAEEQEAKLAAAEARLTAALQDATGRKRAAEEESAKLRSVVVEIGTQLASAKADAAKAASRLELAALSHREQLEGVWSAPSAVLSPLVG